MDSGEEITAFVIDEGPTYITWILKGNKQEIIKKNLFKKIVVKK
jgi:hypothetical protein